MKLTTKGKCAELRFNSPEVRCPDVLPYTRVCQLEVRRSKTSWLNYAQYVNATRGGLCKSSQILASRVQRDGRTEADSMRC